MHVVERAINDICKVLHLDKILYGDIYVAVTEAVHNAMQHGNKYSQNKNITLKYTYTNDFLEFEISDEGDGFSPNNLDDPTAPENIERESGRGVYLIKKLAHHVRFNEKGNTIYIRFNLNSVAALQ